MDSEALKIVLKLKEENVILKRALVEARAMIQSKQPFLSLVFPYGNDDEYGLVSLFKAIDKHLFKNVEEPTDNGKDTEENVS